MSIEELFMLILGIIGIIVLSTIMTAVVVYLKENKNKSDTEKEDDFCFVFYDQCFEILRNFKRERQVFNSISELIDSISPIILNNKESDVEDSKYILLYGAVCYILIENNLEKDLIRYNFIEDDSSEDKEDNSVDSDVLSRFSEKIEPHSKSYSDQNDSYFNQKILIDSKYDKNKSVKTPILEKNNDVYSMTQTINNFYEE